MELNREQSDSSIKYIEDVLENWEQWQAHHSKLTKAMKDLISFAKQLTEENERLRAEVSVKRKLLGKAEVRIECVEAENNQLKSDICNATMNLEHITKENESLEDNLIKQSTENIMLLMDKNKIKADTVRKMQERLVKRFKGDKDNVYTVYNIHRYIDQIAKEMLEGEKGETTNEN